MPILFLVDMWTNLANHSKGGFACLVPGFSSLQLLLGVLATLLSELHQMCVCVCNILNIYAYYIYTYIYIVIL